MYLSTIEKGKEILPRTPCCAHGRELDPLGSSVTVQFPSRHLAGGNGDLRLLVAAGGADSEPGGRRPEAGEVPAEARVLVGEAVAPAAEELAVDLRLLELGPGPPVLEPHLHLPRAEPHLPRQLLLLALRSIDAREKNSDQIDYLSKIPNPTDGIETKRKFNLDMKDYHKRWKPWIS